MFNFNGQKKVSKKLLGLLAGLILFVAVFIFICPMPGMSSADSGPSITVSCAFHDGHATMPFGQGSPNCINWRISAIKLFVGSLSLNANAFMIGLILLLCVSVVFFEILKFVRLGSLPARLKNLQFFYSQILQKLREKMLAWLSYTNHQPSPRPV